MRGCPTPAEKSVAKTGEPVDQVDRGVYSEVGRSWPESTESARLRRRVVIESHVQLVEQAAREYERDSEPVVSGGVPAVGYEPSDEFDFDAWAVEIRSAGEAARAGRRRGRAGRSRPWHLVHAVERGFAMRALTTCLAGISTRAPVAGLRPMRFSRCCTTSFAIPGSTNSPHRNSSCSVSCCRSSKNSPASRTLDAKALGEMREQLALAHSAGLSHATSPLPGALGQQAVPVETRSACSPCSPPVSPSPRRTRRGCGPNIAAAGSSGVGVDPYVPRHGAAPLP